MLLSTDSFRRDLKTFLFHSVYGHQDTDWLCDVPSVFWTQYKCLSYSYSNTLSDKQLSTNSGQQTVGGVGYSNSKRFFPIGI